ncbi:MAG: phosphoesterase PA-phosphatase related protein [Cyanobacteria bacterium RYN_339]|nr:phosphoesterase PA-phosphatase related protein [Cyanobacteria bacterium RYN_339]
MNRHLLLPLFCAAALVAGAPLPVVAADGPTTAPEMPLSVAPETTKWAPAMIKDADALVPPAPPAYKSPAALAEMKEIKEWQNRRNNTDLKAIAYWNDVPVPMRWSEEVRAEIITASMVPPRAARALALVHAAMYDATLVAWKAKGKYKRPLPAQENPFLKAVAGDPGIPSYPSEHAAVSMAAAVTMAAIFPDHKDQLLKKARLVGETRIAAGAAHRSDVEAGFKIGEAVAAQILAQRTHDGAERANPPLAKVPGKWWVPEPMESGAGAWQTFLLTNGHQFRMTYDHKVDVKDVMFAAGLKEVRTVHDKLTPHQIERAIYWNFDVPALLWNDIARRAVVTGKKPAKPDSMGIMWNDIARKAIAQNGMDTPHTARMLNVLHLTLADAFIGVWDTKYVNRVPRPFMMADPKLPLQTVVPTPPHPSWPSGHATASMAAAVVLSKYFPAQSKYFHAQAEEAAMSRLWGGIHYRKDNEDGLKLGKKIGEYCLKQADAKGWTK